MVLESLSPESFVQDSFEESQIAPSLEVSPSLSVCANIHQKQYLPFWRDVLKCGPWHIGVLQDRYQLDFNCEKVPDYEEKNNKSARDNVAFVRDQLDAMCSAGILQRVSNKPKCVSPLTVASRTLPNGTKKLRLCFDGSRHVNCFLKPLKVKLTHFPKVAELLSEKDFQVSLDLKSFYYHLGIAPSHKKFLGVASDQPDGMRQYFQYSVLAFGIAPAAAIMTRLVKPLIAYLASNGIKVSIYLDDAKVNAASKKLAWTHYQKTKEVFLSAGFVISAEKSDDFSDISQQKLYLGFIMDSVRMTASASDEKMESILNEVTQFLTQTRTGVKDLAKITGRIASLRPALGNFVLLVSRSAYVSIEMHTSSFGWSGYLDISSNVMKEFHLFLQHAHALNGFPLLQEHRQRSIQDLLRNAPTYAGDASALGVCAYNIQHPSKFFFQEAFSPAEASLSSGHRELLTLKKAFLSGKVPHSSTVCWYTDSTNLVSFWEKGSPKSAIQSDVVELLLFCKASQIFLHLLHLSRTDPRIEAADVGS